MKTNHKAFTLIELLLAISLMSLVFVGVYSAFWGGVSLSKRSEDNNELFREIRWAMDLISTDMENMVGYDFAGSYTDKTAFSGSEDKISFIAEDQDGLKVISYYLFKPEDIDRHEVKIGQTYKKNVSGVIRQKTEGVRHYYLVREKKNFLDYLTDASDDLDGIEIISTHMAPEGLRFSFGFVEENSQEMVYKPEWINNYIPSNVIVEIDFVVPEENEKRLAFQREILVPSGYGGSTQESETQQDLMEEGL